MPRQAEAGGFLARARRALRHAPDDVDAVVLRHSRIYILPTLRGLAVIGTLLTMLLASLHYGLSLGFIVTFVLAGLVGASLLHTFRNIAGLEIGPVAAAENFVGTPLAFTLALDGHGSDRVAVALRASRAPAAVHDVPVEGRMRVTLAPTPEKRGPVALGRITLESEFPLGLWRAWTYVHFPLTGLAYPQPEAGAPPVPRASQGVREGSGGGHDDADLAGLRDYQVGDPLQRVAWKAVARGGGWYTKQFEGTGGGRTTTLDWSALPASLDVEARLSRLAAWVLACERSMRPYALRLPGAELPSGVGRDQRREALTLLANFDGGPR
jgi:uncharacterized protein (DUF58 family)